MTTRTSVDRAALVRRAMVELVAERGIHGTSMSQVSERAGVATGTAYVHYGSKEEVLIAAFVEIKELLGSAAIHGVELDEGPHTVFDAVWRRFHEFLQADPAVARFLTQLEASPLRGPAHEALSGDDPLTKVADTIGEHLIDLPGEILYDLALAPAVRLVAGDVPVHAEQLDLLIGACWRAVSVDNR